MKERRFRIDHWLNTSKERYDAQWVSGHILIPMFTRAIDYMHFLQRKHKKLTYRIVTGFTTAKTKAEDLENVKIVAIEPSYENDFHPWHSQLVELCERNILYMMHPDWPEYAEFDPLEEVWNTEVQLVVRLIKTQTMIVCGDNMLLYHWEEGNGSVLNTGVHYEESFRSHSNGEVHELRPRRWLEGDEPLKPKKRGMIRSILSLVGIGDRK